MLINLHMRYKHLHRYININTNIYINLQLEQALVNRLPSDNFKLNRYDIHRFKLITIRTLGIIQSYVLLLWLRLMYCNNDS